MLLQRGRQPQASIAWILTIAFVPYLGALAFLLFGTNPVHRRRQERAATVGELDARSREDDAVGLADLAEWPRRGAQAAEIVHRLCGTRPTRGNRVEVIADTNRTLGLIEQAIREATHHVHLEYYIWNTDQTGRRLRDLLIERARDGIRIRFVYDSFGSLFLRGRFVEPMVAAGIEVATFLPGQTWRERWSLNNRSHRKIIVVDGRIGFTGGMNIGDEYLGLLKRSGRWRDSHLRIEGPAVRQLQAVFQEDWYFARNEDFHAKEYFPDPEVADGGQIAQMIAGGPSDLFPAMHAILFGAINAATEQILLTTGYFVPTDSLTMALGAAAIRGVEVRILVPGHTPHLTQATIWAGRSYYDKLLEAGCRIWEYTGGTLHAKTLAVDGQWALVGSANFDHRSTLLNFEVGCIVYGPQTAAELADQFDRDLRHADPVTADERAGISNWRRFGENFTRLFAPIL